jgi:hypothetical protein
MLAIRSEFGDPYAELFSHDHNLASANAPAVGVDVHGLRGAALELENGSGGELHHLTYGELDAPNFHADRQSDIQKEVGGLRKG